MLVTVATPTYNRAPLLTRLYQSLCRQTCSDFEWLIVDDGSTDGSEQIVKDFISERKITIKYLRKPNGGKHTAINLAVRKAQGELFFITDSDDWLSETAIADVLEAYSVIKNDENFCGVCGLDQYADGAVVGSGLSHSTIDASPQEIREKWGGDRRFKGSLSNDSTSSFPFP